MGQELFNPATGEVFEVIDGEAIQSGFALSLGPDIFFADEGGGMAGLGDDVPWLTGPGGIVLGTTPGIPSIIQPAPTSTGTSTATRPRTVGSSGSSGGGRSIWDRLTPIIAGGLTVLNNWVITRPGANNSLLTQYSNGQQYQRPLTQAEYQQLLLAQQQQNAFTAGAGSGGINIGGLQVSWPTLAIIGLGIYLLQRPGYSRR